MFFLKELPTRSILLGYKARVPGMNVEAVEAALSLLRRASLLERRLDAYFSSRSLSQLRFLILIVLDREGDEARLKASEIAARLDVSRPVMTRTLQGLEMEGAITVDGHEQDGRARSVSLSELGRTQLYDALPGYYEILDAYMRRDDRPRSPDQVNQAS